MYKSDDPNASIWPSRSFRKLKTDPTNTLCCGGTWGRRPQAHERLQAALEEQTELEAWLRRFDSLLVPVEASGTPAEVAPAVTAVAEGVLQAKQKVLECSLSTAAAGTAAQESAGAAAAAVEAKAAVQVSVFEFRDARFHFSAEFRTGRENHGWNSSVELTRGRNMWLRNVAWVGNFVCAAGGGGGVAVGEEGGGGGG
jgi:hypothetical protein